MHIEEKQLKLGAIFIKTRQDAVLSFCVNDFVIGIPFFVKRNT